MGSWIANDTIAHLRDVAEWPDLGARYEVTGRLGRGGMGVVFAARDRVLDRQVAVKVLDGVAPANDLARRLQQEARILARLEHPGIVPVHDAGSLPDGRIFYVMKLVRGVRLDSALAGDSSVVDRLQLFLRICDAVSFAHAQGVVHRDLKPENVMLGPFGDVLVMDWGVAKVMSPDSIDPPNVVVGTPGFMPPEQASGHAMRVDARADVYALGAILQAMFRASLPSPLRAIAHHACADEVDQRYQSVDELARDVVRYRDGEPVLVYPETLLERLARVYRRYRVPILLVLAYMVMRVVLLVWS
jgi:serine/threonine protein kinase